MAVITKDLGAVSAYAVAVANGFTGTEAEWEQYMANAANNAMNAAGSATAAANSAASAAQSATEAATSKVAAAGSAVDAENSALVAGNHAATAAASATAAETAETGAESAQTAAEAAQAAAEAVAASIPEDYTELSEDVSSLKSAMNDIREDTPNLFYLPSGSGSLNHLNIAVNSDGTFSASMESGYSTITSVTRFTGATLPVGTYTASMEKISGTGEDGGVYLQFASDVIVRLNTGSSATFTVETEGAIQLCFAKNFGYGQTFKVMLNNGGTALPWAPYGKTAVDIKARESISAIESDIDNLETSASYIGVSVEASGTPAVGADGKYVYAVTMAKSNGTLYAISSAIAVNKGDLISVTCAAYNATVEAISYCDSLLTTFRHGVTGTSSAVDEVKTYQMFADEDGYVCFSYYKSAGCSYKILNSAMAEYILGQADQVDTDYQGKEIETFTHGLCIGDSLTQGVFNYDNSGTVDYMVISKYSYPSALSRMTGIEITNKGDGGKTCATWYEVHQNDDLSGHDFCIIQIGVNDISKQEGGWSEVSETALTNIINKVKNENNNIKIYVSTILPTVKTASTRAVTVRIKAVVEGLDDPNVVVVDMESLSHCADKPAYVNGHLTAIGYERLAEDWRNAISYHIKQNPDLYKWVQFIGTNYVGE